MMPDVLGYELNNALSLLRNCGFDVTVAITRPHRGMPDGNKRVVKMELTSSKCVVLTVAFEEKGKGGVHIGL
ncbi:hypothetical protein [Desulforamulus reducens]|uniref:hypothetical protein n=1 Tax=Desulforamulus reducens TaxID=59610 RepID=UPI00059EC8C6|nr:hypothetical protein [Desulforamulus reducens]